MAKYVCDFGAVSSAVSQLNKMASELESNVTGCKTNLDNSLSEWDGEAKTAYSNSSDQAFSSLEEDINNLKMTASYIQTVAAAIEEAESELAGLKI